MIKRLAIIVLATTAFQANLMADWMDELCSFVDVKERTVGYKLTIETSLYNEASDIAIREYATSCVVNGNNVPMQFSISETDNDA